MEFSYRCSLCARSYDITPELTLCPTCSAQQQPDQPLHGVLDVELVGEVGADFSVFDLLPVEREFFPPAPVGNTPLWEPRNVRASLGFPQLYIKDDGSNPTASFKDRASYLVSAFARKFSINEITLASTGNAGSSMAGIGAAAGQQITLFLPESAPIAKLIQALQYGAKVYRVAGNYDLAYDISLDYSRRKGGMNRNTAYNPMTIEGKKSVALELFQQLGRAPDTLFVSVGDGCILSGVYKGFRDLKQLGLIADVPKIIGVQAEGSDALCRALQTGEFTPRPAATVADSISVDVPRNGLHALQQLKTFNGELMTVSDDEIIAAQVRLSASTGLFTEPAGAAAFAGFIKAAPDLDRNALTVVLTTGNGLKDSRSAQLGIHLPEELIGSIDDIL
ncbi:MAG: pyridoxal-5'-phosphate-dependent protein subunit beta [Desulfuromonas sp.]|nr:MAG: pyridoxal-5'-phosphate-dependent protein subunit beta [Desulfuromonas sp.]